MLKGINPLLNAQVLAALRAMGHGDDLVIVDTNFPSDSVARRTGLGELLRIDNTTAAQAIEAVLSVMPLDTFVDDKNGVQDRNLFAARVAANVMGESTLGAIVTNGNPNGGPGSTTIGSGFSTATTMPRVNTIPASMEIVGAPDEVPPVQREVQAVIDAAEGRPWPMVSVERFAFYERAKQAYCVIQTGERRFYGCIALRKGVIPPDAG